MKKLENKEIGLALGGGAVLGAAHIGVIKALEEFEIKADYVSGTSIGALVGAMYAFGLKAEDMESIALELNWLDISGFSISNKGLLSNKKIGTVIQEHLGDVDFSDTEIPFSAIATDLASGKKVTITKGKIGDAVMASTCIPGIFIPIEREGQVLVDGGIVENVPVSAVQDLGAKYTIGVDLNSGQPMEKPTNILQILLNTVKMSLANVSKFETQDCDLVIIPKLDGFNAYDIEQVPRLIECGYQSAVEKLQALNSEQA